MNFEQVYASVDLELSGFDPQEDEIIEIGIVTFTVRSGVLVVLDRYESLCRPKSDVRNRILGLTGIDQAEVMSAPLWNEVLPKVKDLLTDTVIVGHGVGMDSKFLETNGVTVSGALLDTLELAQIFLPTHHSYNLENLAATLGVEHSESHRALADAEAAFGILSKMGQIFQSLPAETKERLRVIAMAHKLLWFELFSTLRSLEDGFVDKSAKIGSTTVIANLPAAFGSQGVLIGSGPGTKVLPNFRQLSTSAVPYVVAFSQRSEVLSVAKEYGISPYLGAFEQVKEQRLEELIENVGELHSREIIALCKVLVWRGTVKGFGLLAELNWSIIGTDLKKLFVVGYASQIPSGLAVADLRSVSDFTDRRNLWVDQLDACVEFLEQKSGLQVSWAGIVSQIKALARDRDGLSPYLSEEQLFEMIGMTDVFFARVVMLLKQEMQLVSGSVAFKSLGLYELSRITQSAKNFCDRLNKLLKQNGSDPALVRIAEQIRRFFEAIDGSSYVRWIEVGDGKCSFVMRMVDLSDSFRTWTRGKEQVICQTDFCDQKLIEYFKKRLGIVSAQHKADISVSIKMPSYSIVVKADLQQSLVDKLADAEDCLVVFPTIAQLRGFYDAVVGTGDLRSTVIAVGVHGGVQKVLRNFAHSKKTIILATVPQLASFYGEKLACKRLIFAGLPTVDINHPYNLELVNKYFNRLEEFKYVMASLAIIQVFRAMDFAILDTAECVVVAEESSLATELLDTILMNNLSTV